MGVPLLMAAYGEAAALPAVLAVVLDTLVLQSLTIFLLESGSTAGSGGSLRDVAWAVTRNPLIIAVVAGGVVAALDLELPAPVTGFLGLLGPGGGRRCLVRPRRHAARRRDGRGPAAGRRDDHGQAPAAAGGGLAGPAGGPGTRRPAGPLIIATALPTAASVFVIAQRYGVLERQVAAIVFGSHLLGILTLTGLLVLLPG